MAGSILYNNPTSPPAIRIISVENNGNWKPGEIYEIVYRKYQIYKFDEPFPVRIFDYIYDIAPIDYAVLNNADDNIFLNNQVSDYAIKSTPFVYTGTTRYLHFSDLTGRLLATTWARQSITVIYDNSVAGHPSDEDFCWEFTYNVTVPDNASIGTYRLMYFGAFFQQDVGGGNDCTVATKLIKEYFEITISSSGGSGGGGGGGAWPPPGGTIYDDDGEAFDETNDVWTTNSGIITSGGGRYGNQLIAINDQGDLYFGDLN